MTQDTKIEAVGHTAGPWRIEQDTTLIWGNCDPDDTSDRGMGYPIAECRITPISYSSWAKGPTEDEGEANARLIAAAPEMLDALRSAKEELYQIAHSSCDPDSPDAMDSIACAYRECRDAVRKAEGRAS